MLGSRQSSCSQYDHEACQRLGSHCSPSCHEDPDGGSHYNSSPTLKRQSCGLGQGGCRLGLALREKIRWCLIDTRAENPWVALLPTYEVPTTEVYIIDRQRPPCPDAEAGWLGSWRSIWLSVGEILQIRSRQSWLSSSARIWKESHPAESVPVTETALS